MIVRIYQIVPELDNDNLMFSDLRRIEMASGGQVPAELYEEVFNGELSVSSPEEVFTVFNTAHPTGYKGRSLSISDVVEFVHSPESSTFYFCEPIGFAQVGFDAEKAMLPIQNHDLHKEEIIKCGDLRIGFMDNLGIRTVWCSKLVLTRCRYSRSQLGYRLRYWPWGEDKWQDKTFLSRPKILLANSSSISFPESLLYETTPEGVRKPRFPVFSEGNFSVLEDWCRERHVKPEYL